MLAIWVGGSNLPVHLVEDPNMIKYIETLNLLSNIKKYPQSPPTQATLPSRSTLQRDVISVADKMILKITEALLTARHVSATTERSGSV